MIEATVHADWVRDTHTTHVRVRCRAHGREWCWSARMGERAAAGGDLVLMRLASKDLSEAIGLPVRVVWGDWESTDGHDARRVPGKEAAPAG